ncbi:hypothetical protein OJ996_13530 [Luteolibacter sp. GHJ8]|uniref:Uncharacterized protein n=1 Tax=Luteolibacter rhizosphaerae TaxID=2989719 RepID=A0ABT3G433_9BACT|nr:hypothetical protein [Luteolibacter rhizosphaerae]MCW1914603.1 hypothetical protein [Luteolibacter rhizosphaerae]
MTRREEKIGKRAVKAGVKAVKRKHHLLSEEELRGLKVQILSNPLRITLFLLSLGCGACAALGWPNDSNATQGAFICIGILLLVFSIFGIRRTLGSILDAMPADGAIELVGNVLGGIADLVGGAVDL